MDNKRTLLQQTDLLAFFLCCKLIRFDDNLTKNQCFVSAFLYREQTYSSKLISLSYLYLIHQY